MNETEQRAIRLQIQVANSARNELLHRVWAYYDHPSETTYDAWREAARVSAVLDENLNAALAMVEQLRIEGIER